ncbi:hypothetical protein [Acuticoccus kandeliae]|uniref:hypothetical protein n=1 Tax=Acuticoccus kandeliae TaxID=2073160 RepID=UPI000D3E0494|nr:hypothetical protein [Acuticoccus kandeliae]
MRGFGVDDAKVAEIVEAYREDAPAMAPSDTLFAVCSEVQFRVPLAHVAEMKSATPGRARAWMVNLT